MDLLSLLIAALIVIVIYYILQAIGVPSPIPTIVAVIILLLMITGRLSLHL